MKRADRPHVTYEYNNNSKGILITKGSNVIVPLFPNTPLKDVLADVPPRVDTTEEIPITIIVKDADENDYPVYEIRIYDDKTDDDDDTADDELEYTLDLDGDSCLLASGFENIDDDYWYRIVKISQTNFSDIGGYAKIHILFDAATLCDPTDWDTHVHLSARTSGNNLPELTNWSCGDQHVHSWVTDDIWEFGAPVEAIRDAGKAMGIDYVIITDHSYDIDPFPDEWNNLKIDCGSNSSYDFICLAGEEISCDEPGISEGAGHLLAYGITTPQNSVGIGPDWFPYEPDQQDAIDFVEGQSGFAYIAHPFGGPDPIPLVEIWDWDDIDSSQEYTGLEVFHETWQDEYDGRTLDKWVEYLLDGDKIYGIGNSDAHDLHSLGKARAYIYTETFTEDGIIDALHNGHSIMTDGPLVVCNITNEFCETAIIGGEIAGQDLTLNVQWVSTSEFGNVSHIYVHRGIIGETEEGDEIYHLTPNNLSGTATLDLTSKIPQPQLKTVYIRLNATTDEGYCVHTNPIWINGPIDRGLQYLRTTQKSDGSWSSDVGITSLAALAFLNAGYDENDPDVQDAIGYILKNVKGDDSIYNSYNSRTYQTSLAMLALVATHNDSYNTIIEDATQWLKDSQWDENCLWGSVYENNWYYGGFGYGRNIRPDLSNSQFALMALDAAGVPKDDPLWTKTQVFLNRCQARDASNDQSWANGRNSGGFIYTGNGQVPWSGSINGYGSMTGAGIWGLRLCNVDTDDDRLQDAMKWVSNNYYWDRNPGMGNPGESQFYYYLSMSKALTMMDTDVINGNNWYTDLSQNITSLQSPQGYWINGRSSNGRENNKDLVTSYAILSVQTRGEIPPDIQRLSYLTFILHSNADLHVYDPLGRHVGKNYETGGIDLEIPNATYSVDPQNITIPELIPGNYRIVLVGTGTGEYTLNVTGGVGNDTVSEDSYTGNITEGEVHDAIVNVAMITWLTIHVDEPEPVDPIVLSATGTGNVSFITDAGTIEDLTALNESEMPEENPKADFSHGIFRFNITGVNLGQIVNITIAFPQDIPITAQYWICGPNGSIDNPQPMRWYPIPLGSNDGDNVITITKQDGGIGDEDGVANGIIVDDGGPGNPFGVRATTLTPIGIIALAGLLTVIAVSRVRKKR